MDEKQKDRNMKKDMILWGIAILVISGLSGCSSRHTIIPPEDFALAAGDNVEVRTIRYQDPMIWPKWKWWRNLTSTRPKRWDVVVFRPDPEKTEMRALRVVGLPGEALRFENGRVLVNDQPIAIPEPLKSIRYAPGSFSVPQEQYFLLSDDSQQTNDSRLFGSVHREAIRSRIDSVESGK